MTDSISLNDKNLSGRTVLIVGAGGFIGGFLAAEGLRRDADVTCMVRPTTNRRYLTDPALKFVEVESFDDISSIAAALQSTSTRWQKQRYKRLSNMHLQLPSHCCTSI